MINWRRRESFRLLITSSKCNNMPDTATLSTACILSGNTAVNKSAPELASSLLRMSRNDLSSCRHNKVHSTCDETDLV